MLDLLDKDLKSVIINMFKEPKETMSKELKKSMRIISHQIKNINKRYKLLQKPNLEEK